MLACIWGGKWEYESAIAGINTTTQRRVHRENPLLVGKIHHVQATPTSTYFITFSSVGM